jgi:hypothetical protein
VLLTLLAVLAATSAADPPSEVHFRALAFDTPRLQLAIAVNKKPVSLEVYGQALTPEITAPVNKEGVLEILKPAAPDSNGKPTYAPYTDVVIPPGNAKYLFIISGNQEKGKVTLINDNDANGAGGTMRFFNLSGRAVSLAFPGFNQTLNGNDNTTFHPNTKNGEYGQAQVLVTVDGTWKPAKNLRWLQLEDTRVIYFILADPTDPQRVLLRGIEERILPAAPPTPEAPKANDKKSAPTPKTKKAGP